MGRAVLPEGVAGAAVFLASPLASYVTGAVIEVTGAGESDRGGAMTAPADWWSRIMP